MKMKFIKNILMALGALLIIGLVVAYVKFGSNFTQSKQFSASAMSDYMKKFEQVKQLDPKAMDAYIKMFDTVLATGDPAKGMVIKRKLHIPEDMTKQEAIENALEIMDEVGSEHGLAMVDTKLMSRGEKDETGVYRPYIRIRSYCSKTIAEKFLAHSPEFIGFMPCRIGLVEDKKGDIYLYTMSLELMIYGGRSLPPEMLELAKEVESGMYSMLDMAAANEE
jgi:hypothetical protein